MIRVEGHKHLYRTDDGGIVNTDTVAYNQYMRLKNKRKSAKDDEIKSMIKDLKNP